jgi:ABC-type polysaccharide/polyol phosphate export permease
LPLTLLLLTLEFSIGMFIASVGTFRRDIIFATPFLMQFLLYATPVMYSLQSVPERYRLLYSLNPAVGIIDGFRNVLIHGRPPQAEPLIFSAVVTIALLSLSWPIFRKVSQYFSDMK